MLTVRLTRWKSTRRHLSYTSCETILDCGALGLVAVLPSAAGVCTVIIDGVATRSCVTLASDADGQITTLEGLSKGGTLDPVQQAWIDEQVPQCGFCQNGQIMTAKALLDRNPNPTDAEIREEMDGVLCRCMTYYRVQAAIKRLARGVKATDGVIRSSITQTNVPETTSAVGNEVAK